MTTAPHAPLALAYCRVSTLEQADEGASLDAQESRLRSEAAHRGWVIEIVREEGKSAKSITGRPLLVEALRRLDAKEADVLLAVRLDRVSRSLHDFAGLYERSERKGWALVVPESGIDTTAEASPTARFSAQIQAAAAEFERGLISMRTKEGMAQRKAEGVHIGRPRSLPQDVLDRIVADRASGLSLDKIAAGLNADGVQTAHGGLTWRSSTLSAILKSLASA
jgi:DNA invertase Pin-like site-specific DNA recombinase